jgi:hypothetical protein
MAKIICFEPCILKENLVLKSEKRAGGMAQALEHLLSKRETLSSNYLPPKKVRKENSSDSFSTDFISNKGFHSYEFW